MARKKNEVIVNADYNPNTLEQATQQIVAIEESTVKNLYKIAFVLTEVKKKELFKEKGYKDTQEYAEKELEYKKSTTHALIQVKERFISDELHSIFKKEDDKDFTVYQLRELLPMHEDVIAEAVENGEITPYMSVRAIKDVVKTYKAIDSTPKLDDEQKSSSTKKPETSENEKPETSENEKPETSENEKQPLTKTWLIKALNDIETAAKILYSSTQKDDVAMNIITNTIQLIKDRI